MLLAAVWVAQGQPERGARLLGASEALLESLQADLLASENTRLGLLIAAVRSLVGEALADAVEEGRKLSWEQTLAYTLGETGEDG